MNNEKIYEMKLSKIYSLLLYKCVRKGRTEEELLEVMKWFTGYSESELKSLIISDISYSSFFTNATMLNPNRKKIKGKICGVNIDEIQEPLMKEIRYLDKLVDELAKGKSINQILYS